VNNEIQTPDAFKSENAHNDSELTLELPSELKQYRDPCAAVVFATYSGEGTMGETAMNESLVEIGSPAIPYKRPDAAAKVLGLIGAQHREDLERVIKHILIPKLEAVNKTEVLPIFLKRYRYTRLDCWENRVSFIGPLFPFIFAIMEEILIK